jgi:hypothetical protein
MRARAHVGAFATLAAALALAGCGGGSSSPSGTTSTASGSATVSTDSAAASSAAESGRSDADANAAAAASAEAAGDTAPGSTTPSGAYPEPRKTPTRALVEKVRQQADAPTRQAVTAVVVRYMHAIAHHDYRTACATRTPAERRALARLGRSCPELLRRAYRRTDASRSDRIRVTAVRRRGDVAVALLALGDVTMPADDAVIAQRVGGDWRLVDLEG